MVEETQVKPDKDEKFKQLGLVPNTNSVFSKEPKIKPSQIIFYTLHNINDKKVNINSKFLEEKLSKVKYPCILLIRNNSWNDYSYVTQFKAFFFSEDKKIKNLDTIKIIEKNAKFDEEYNQYLTILDKEFTQLDKNKYFSKGIPEFYKALKELPFLKKEDILHALNEINIEGYTSKHFLTEELESLYFPYINSLLRLEEYELSTTSDYYSIAMKMFKNIIKMSQEISEDTNFRNNFMINMLYGSSITTFESYLGDAFKHNVLNNNNYFISFLRLYQFPQGEKKYCLKDLGIHGEKVLEFIKDEVKKILNNIIFHKIEVVYAMYKDILGIKLPEEIWDFEVPIQNRHSIFHRNGKNKNNEILEISRKELMTLITNVERFIKDTEHKLNNIL